MLGAGAEVGAFEGGGPGPGSPAGVGAVAAASPVCVSLRDAAAGGAADDVDLDVREGEIVGIAGLQGAGHEELLQVLWARRRRDGDVAFIPSDRKRFGLMLDKPVWENVTAVTALAAPGSRRVLRPAALRAVAQEWVDELRIRCRVDDPAGRLSGGNQQKVVFAKWLATDPRLLLLDDPTRGVDVGAKREMHTLVRRLAGQGRGVLVCSTDLAELVELCDRVLLMRRGRVAREAAPAELSEAGLLAALSSLG
jgi:ABC-type sugar transport system ATPase subunit